jgi:hypothetical protein
LGASSLLGTSQLMTVEGYHSLGAEGTTLGGRTAALQLPNELIGPGSSSIGARLVVGATDATSAGRGRHAFGAVR